MLICARIIPPLQGLIVDPDDGHDLRDEAATYWTLMAFLANMASLYLLVRLFNAEGKRFWDILRFSRETWKKDLLWFIGFSIISMPIAAAPREPLAAAIFGDAMVATNMMFRPIPPGRSC
jgi:hypothetical protein